MDEIKPCPICTNCGQCMETFSLETKPDETEEVSLESQYPN